MTNFFITASNSIRAFAKEEEGAQIIEYALIVAVISLGLIALINTGLLASSGGFTGWIANVTSYLTTGGPAPLGP